MNLCLSPFFMVPQLLHIGGVPSLAERMFVILPFLVMFGSFAIITSVYSIFRMTIPYLAV